MLYQLRSVVISTFVMGIYSMRGNQRNMEVDLVKSSFAELRTKGCKWEFKTSGLKKALGEVDEFNLPHRIWDYTRGAAEVQVVTGGGDNGLVKCQPNQADTFPLWAVFYDDGGDPEDTEEHSFVLKKYDYVGPPPNPAVCEEQRWEKLARVPAEYVRDLLENHSGEFDLAELFFGTIEVDHNGSITHLKRDDDWFERLSFGEIGGPLLGKGHDCDIWTVTQNTDSGPRQQRWTVKPKGTKTSFEDYFRSTEEAGCHFQVFNPVSELMPVGERR